MEHGQYIESVKFRRKENMKDFRVWYIGIGGRKDYAIIEAFDAYEARKEFENTHWAYHEILSVEPVRP